MADSKLDGLVSSIPTCTDPRGAMPCPGAHAWRQIEFFARYTNPEHFPCRLWCSIRTLRSSWSYSCYVLNDQKRAMTRSKQKVGCEICCEPPGQSHIPPSKPISCRGYELDAWHQALQSLHPGDGTDTYWAPTDSDTSIAPSLQARSTRGLMEAWLGDGFILLINGHEANAAVDSQSTAMASWLSCAMVIHRRIRL